MAAFDLRAPNGQLIEYQVVTREMLEANAIEHDMYKKFRKVDVKDLTEAERIEHQIATGKAVRLYRKADKDYAKRTGHTKSDIERIIKDAQKILSDGM